MILSGAKDAAALCTDCPHPTWTKYVDTGIVPDVAQTECFCIQHKCFDESKDNKAQCELNDLYDASDVAKSW